jgi:hypothetical protein
MQFLEVPAEYGLPAALDRGGESKENIMKRILTIVSVLLLAMPAGLFAGNSRGGGAKSGGGPNGIHQPGTGQPSGSPQGTPGGQRLRDGTGAGQQKQKGKRQGPRDGRGRNGPGSGTCPTTTAH